jgi:TetR/AcrR family transcriptional repressor of nem operon
MAITTGDTKDRIMAAARLTVQDRGYGGLSFRELAKDVGIKSASIHHYFPTKGKLGSALAVRYTSDFLEYLDGLLAEGLDQKACIRKYTDVFGRTVPTIIGCTSAASWQPNSANCLRRSGSRW